MSDSQPEKNDDEHVIVGKYRPYEEVLLQIIQHNKSENIAENEEN